MIELSKPAKSHFADHTSYHTSIFVNHTLEVCLQVWKSVIFGITLLSHIQSVITHVITHLFLLGYKWSSKCKWSQIVQQMIPWLETIPRLCHKQSPDQKWSPLNNQGKCKDSGIWTVDLNLCNGFFRTVKLKKLSTLCVDSESLIVYWTNHNKVKGKWEETAAVCGLLIFPCYRTQ